MFYNPLLVAPHPDPWVIYEPPWFWFCGSEQNRIYILQAETLTGLGTAKPQTVWTAPAYGPHSQSLWAPELHHLEDRWLIYYAADDGDNHNHRMYVLESKAPWGPYEFRGKISTSDDHWAIDGTVLSHPDGSLYFVWSGWEGNEDVAQHLYVAPMDRARPWTLTGPRVKISSPELSWERCGRPFVNEGPSIVLRNDTIYLFYSASGSWTADYCLGLLTCPITRPVLDAASWAKHARPVFSQNEEAGVYGVGHASFVQDGHRQWWIVYHGMDRPDAGWPGRSTRIQPFEWSEDGHPVLGTPWPLAKPLDLRPHLANGALPEFPR